MNLLHLLSSLGNSGASFSKVNMESHASHHVTSSISKISQSLNHVNIGYWIVDSGDTDHICSSMKLFYSYQLIAPVNIRLPNDHMAMEKYSRIVTLSSSLIVQDVLFVHDFNLNLLLVP